MASPSPNKPFGFNPNNNESSSKTTSSPKAVEFSAGVTNPFAGHVTRPPIAGFGSHGPSTAGPEATGKADNPLLPKPTGSQTQVSGAPTSTMSSAFNFRAFGAPSLAFAQNQQPSIFGSRAGLPQQTTPIKVDQWPSPISTNSQSRTLFGASSQTPQTNTPRNIFGPGAVLPQQTTPTQAFRQTAPATMPQLSRSIPSATQSSTPPSTIMPSLTAMNGDINDKGAVSGHFSLMGGVSVANDQVNEVTSAPLFSGPALIDGDNKSKRTGRLKENFSQYGLLGGVIDDAFDGFAIEDFVTDKDPRIFQNVAAPMSAFVCGSQGSGKSHTLSCMLENCLLASPASHLPRPLTGLVFHYDSFVSDTGGAPCEAAFLSSHQGIKVKVLCAPTNVGQIRRIYRDLPNVVVEELRINQADLNTKRMMDLMAFNPNGGKGTPLYLHVINRILRDLRIEQQRNGTQFNYLNFKMEVYAQDLTDGQAAPLKQRLETLESFMVASQAQAYDDMKKGKKGSTGVRAKVVDGNDWKPKAGQLTIVDMSCPCVTEEMACSLFNIALSLFLEQKSHIGRVVALDEAHKYMTDSMESQTLTESLMSTIRLQRHIGARIIISTQEPTISPKLLDLCSVTIVHRFTSPDWLHVLRQHLAGVSSRSAAIAGEKSDTTDGGDKITSAGVQPLLFEPNDIAQQIFSRIIALRTGEALVFSPTAIVGMQKTSPAEVEVPKAPVSVKDEGDAPEGVVPVKKDQQPATALQTPAKESPKIGRTASYDSLVALTPVSGTTDDFASDTAPVKESKDSATESKDTATESKEAKPRPQQMSLDDIFGHGKKSTDPTGSHVPPGTSAADYVPYIGEDGCVFQHTGVKEGYQHWSSDELRVVDYHTGHKQSDAYYLVPTTGNSTKLEKEDKVPVRLGRGVLKVRIRGRVTADGGKSVFAT